MAPKELKPGTPAWALHKGLSIIRHDDQVLERLDNYLGGQHDPVYIPDNADAEYRLLAKRAILNMVPLVVNSLTQVCYVDSIRHAKAQQDLPTDPDGATDEALPPEMLSWQYNRMDARQLPITRALATHGSVYLLTRKDPRSGRARYEGYSARRAVALFEDPVNDLDPVWGIIIKKGTASDPRVVWLYGETEWWIATPNRKGDLVLAPQGKHGNSSCPLTRGVLHQDLEGRPSGLVAPIIEAQDQVNQTSFDALTIQSNASFKVRTATGMAVPIRRWTREEIEQVWPTPDPDDPEYDTIMHQRAAEEIPQVGDPVLDHNGQEIPLPIKMNSKRLLVAEDPETEFGTLDETNLAPLLAALDQRIKHLAAISQTPPTYFMGELANLSAEALQAAEISKKRRDDEARMALGEMYERNIRLGMELEGHPDRADDVSTEMVWADTDPRSIAAVADALAKMVDSLEVPPTAAWLELPGMTTAKYQMWLSLREQWEEEHPEVRLARQIGDADLFNNDSEVPLEA